MEPLKKKKIVDYVFWIVFIAFTNPGGILEAIGENSADGGINVTDILFVILFSSFIIIFKKKSIDNIFYKKIVKYLFIFLLYYLVFFAFFIPLFRNSSNYSIIEAYIKIRYAVIHFFLVIMVYEFYLRSYVIFWQVFLYSSILVIVLFIITVTTGINLLEVREMNRGFVATKRLIMSDFGLLTLLVPMGVVVIVFKFKFKFKIKIVLASVLMFLVWILAILRRFIFGAFLYFILASILDNYFKQKPLIPIKNIFNIGIYLILLFFIIQLSFPKYLDAGILSVKETYNVFKYGETVSGQKDARLGFGKSHMQNTIRKNFIFGTGFDNRWRTKEGDNDGFEASDYPFLSAIAMFGITGLMIFLPVYIVIIKILIFDIKYLRKNSFNNQSYEAYFVILFIIYFIFNLVQYMNWFEPVAIFSHNIGKRWFVFLGLFFAARKVFYDKEKYINSSNFRSF